MPSTSLTFSSRDAHRAWLASQAALPAGFRVGTTRFEFMPREAPKPAKMTLTLIALEQPTADFAAMFTRNAFPGAPIIVGRKRLGEPTLGAIIVNNKVSNVCAPGGVETSEQICAATAQLLGLEAGQVLPSSTGVIGWTLPGEAIIAALPQAVSALTSSSVLPAAEGIVTTDLYPKVRRADIGGGSIVGIAKGAGMIEPNLATMLVYLFTDIAVPRRELRAMLARAVDASFNAISVDSDTSTSDTVALLSSSRVPCSDVLGFERGLHQVCRDLAEDVVRNGEGVRHVIRVTVKNAASLGLARTPTWDRTLAKRLARGEGDFDVKFPEHGRHVEANISQQILALIGTGGKVQKIYPMSSGKPSTPTVLGHFSVYRKDLGTNAKGMVNSSYFIRGYAIHGYAEVPTYNASHGCLRVPIPDSMTIFNWVTYGTKVDVYR